MEPKTPSPPSAPPSSPSPSSAPLMAAPLPADGGVPDWAATMALHRAEAERDDALAERAEACSERDVACAERDEAHKSLVDAMARAQEAEQEAAQKLAAVQAALAHAEAEAHEALMERDHARTERDDARGQRDSAIAAQRRLSAGLKLAQQERDETRDLMHQNDEAHTSRTTELQKDLEHMKDTLQDLQSDSSEKENQLTRMHAERDEALAVQTQTSHDLVKAQTRTAELDQALDQKTQQLSSSEERMRDLEQSERTLKESVAKATALQQQTRKERDAALDDLGRHTMLVANAEKQLKQAHQAHAEEVQELTSAVDTHRQERDTALHALAECRGERDVARVRAETKEAQVASVRAKLASAREAAGRNRAHWAEQKAHWEEAKAKAREERHKVVAKLRASEKGREEEEEDLLVALGERDAAQHRVDRAEREREDAKREREHAERALKNAALAHRHVLEQLARAEDGWDAAIREAQRGHQEQAALLEHVRSAADRTKQEVSDLQHRLAQAEERNEAAQEDAALVRAECDQARTHMREAQGELDEVKVQWEAAQLSFNLATKAERSRAQALEHKIAELTREITRLKDQAGRLSDPAGHMGDPGEAGYMCRLIVSRAEALERMHEAESRTRTVQSRLAQALERARLAEEDVERTAQTKLKIDSDQRTLAGQASCSGAYPSSTPPDPVWTRLLTTMGERDDLRVAVKTLTAQLSAGSQRAPLSDPHAEKEDLPPSPAATEVGVQGAEDGPGKNVQDFQLTCSVLVSELHRLHHEVDMTLREQAKGSHEHARVRRTGHPPRRRHSMIAAHNAHTKPTTATLSTT